MTDDGDGNAYLILEDGSVVRGDAFGASGTAYGELVFNTGMSGYQESLTDPSYNGQVLMFTYPMIGNYGINDADWESDRIWPRAVVVREWCQEPEHRQSTMTIHEWLRDNGVPGISGVDTRALTLKTREKGCLRCFVTHDPDEVDSLRARIQNMPSVEEENLAAEASVDRPHRFGRNPDGVLVDPDGGGPVWDHDAYTVAIIDTGIKRNILRNLVRRFNLVQFPWDATPDQVRQAPGMAGDADAGPDALFLANGPGDPGHPEIVAKTVPTIAELSKEMPTFGICYGNQLVSRAYGATTSKMKFGHRGANIPARDEATGVVRITSQNHGFAVDADSVPGTGLRVAERCPNDGCVEALEHDSLPIFTTQYHPEACPGPLDSGQLFDGFWELVDQVKKGTWKQGTFPRLRTPRTADEQVEVAWV